MFSIQAKVRDISEDVAVLRTKGELPSVYYGAGTESTPISVSLGDFIKVWRSAGESSPVELLVGSKKVNVLIHDVALHAVSNDPIHVDFLVVDMNKKVSVYVPVEFVGVAPAVKNGLGTLVKVMHEIEIEALPKDLPQRIDVDISPLVDLESQILVSDLKLFVGVNVLGKDTEVVAAIAAQQEEKAEAVAPVDLSAIEVEKKGKKEEEGAAAE